MVHRFASSSFDLLGFVGTLSDSSEMLPLPSVLASGLNVVWRCLLPNVCVHINHGSQSLSLCLFFIAPNIGFSFTSDTMTPTSGLSDLRLFILN